MVEVAITLPVVCMLLFGVIQFGIVWNNYVTVTDSVRVGAAKASRSRAYADPPAVAVAAVRASAQSLNQTDLTVAVSSPTWNRGDDVTVTATYPYKIDLLGFVFKEGRLTHTTTERLE